MVYIMLTEGKVIESFELDKIDVLSLMVGAVCHDFVHDGFNNAYHVNANTARSIRSLDQSVQEHYHAAEAFQLMMNKKNNFLDHMTTEDVRTFKRRFIGCIMATDMAKHAEDLATFKRKLELKNVNKGLQNAKELLDHTSGKTKFESQQQVMELVLHSADVSVPCRPDFELVREWTYLLFDEFFCQGDQELKESLSVSFLCDRKTTNVAKSQNGFISFIV